MKTLISTVLLIAIGFFIANATSPNTPSNKNWKGDLEQTNTWLKQYSKQLSFTENKGQVRDQHWNSRQDVLFSGEIGGMVFHIRENGISYQLYNKSDKSLATDNSAFLFSGQLPDRDETDRDETHPQPLFIYRTDIYWENINENYTVETDQAQPGYSNYYNVPENNEPALYVKDFEGMWLKNIYSGIDLHYYSDARGLKYDYIVQPGADYRQIKMRIEGADLEITEDGILLLSTPFGTIKEGKPTAFQDDKKLRSEWVIEDNILSFVIVGHNSNKPLIIDPPVQVWGTYYGDSGSDLGRSCAVDGNGNVFLAGHAGSTANIATTGAHQEIYGGGTNDAFLVQFNGSGVRQWATYYGGSGTDRGFSCAVDGSGNVFLSGETTSTTSIATTGAHQDIFGGNWDAFLVKFNGSGVRQWGTYYGGSDADVGNYCEADDSGNVFLTGITYSNTNIATAGIHQDTYGGGADAFLVQFNGSGIRQWGTYYGGSGNEYGNSCKIDTSGNVFLTGQTNSTTNIASTGAHQEIFDGGVWDAFLVQFTGSGIRQWGTYYGGSDSDVGAFCSVDVIGNVFIGGWAGSTTNIATAGAHQEIYGGGTNDAFLVQFNGSGVRQWGTYYGGTGDDRGSSCNVDDNNNVFLVGFTESTTSISTTGAYQEIYGGGTFDAFLVKFNGSGVRQLGTYYGGGGYDYGNSCAVDSNGNVFLAGHTNSTTNIATSGAHQDASGGGVDGFLVNFYICSNSFSTITLTSCNSYTSPSGKYTWTSSDIYTDTIPNSDNCDSIITVDLTINTVDTSITSNSPTLSAIADPAATYQWIDCNNNFAPLSGEDEQNFTATINGSYAAIISQNTCMDTSSCYTISNVGVEENNNWEGTLRVFPNPALDKFTIDLGQFYSKVKICIKDVQGKEVLIQSGLEGQTHTLDLEQPAGVYFIHIHSEGQTAVLRLAKE